MQRRGFTLVEMMMAVGIGVSLAVMCQTLVSRADRLFDATRRQLELTSDVRALIETALKDVASAQQVLAGGADELVLVRAADTEVNPRLSRNPTWAFPFAAGPSTKQIYPGTKVTYRFDRVRRTVVRAEQRGELSAQTGTASSQLAAFSFEGGTVNERTLCSAVKACTFRSFGYDPQGRLIVTKAPEQTAVVLVDVHARYEEGLYAGQTDRPVPDARLVVPLWCAKRRADAVLPEFFSSTDEDLSW